MVVCEVLPRVYNSVHVSLHQICHYVYVFIPGRSRWLLDVNQGNNILMIEKLQKFDLSYDSLRVNKIFEGLGDLLDGNFGLRLVIVGTTHNTIGTVTDLLNVLEFVINHECSTCDDC